MKIMVDLDSVLNDLVPAWLERYNRDYEDSLTEEDLTEWHTWKFTKPECGNKIYEYLEDPTLFSGLKPLEHSQEVIAQWCISRKHEVYVVSAATHQTMSAKALWIEKYYRTIGLDHIIFATHKHLLRADLLIDDGPHNIITWGNRAVIYSKPWNQALIQKLPNRLVQVKGEIFIVKNWWDIENLVNYLEKIIDG